MSVYIVSEPEFRKSTWCKGITEGLINASTISSKFGITRSVIASALKKLEGAGIISIRSLGMKGTHLTVLNPEIYTVTK